MPDTDRELIIKLAYAVDTLGAQVAALAAIVAHQVPTNDRDIKSAVAIAQQLAPKHVGPLGVPKVVTPLYHPAYWIDRFRSIASDLSLLRSAGQSESTKDRP